MLMRILKKIPRIFVALLCFFIVLGFLMLIVRDYSTPIVSAVEIKGGNITKNYNYTGVVVARDSIEIKASEKLYVNSVNIVNSQIVYPNTPLIFFDKEKLSDIEKNNLNINDSGEFKINKNIYVEYINDKDIIEEGDTIIKYSVHDEDNLLIEVKMDESVTSPQKNVETKFYYFKNYYNDRVKTSISDLRKFSDYDIVYFSVNKSPNSNEKLKINNAVNIIVEVAEPYYSGIVPVTALISIGEIKENSSCYVYCLVEEDTLLGVQTHVLLREAYIHSIGGSKAAIGIINKDGKITDFTNLKFVNYATSAIKDGTRVRVK